MDSLVTLFIFTLFYCVSHVSTQSSFPCPDPVTIMPCTCKLDEATQLMTLDCSRVISTQQLQTVFSADFPFQHFGVFRMVNYPDTPSPVDTLPDGIFGNVSFDAIYITCAQISSIGDNIFEKSYSVMRSIRLQKTLLSTFPFHMLPSFQSLTTIILDYNNLTHMSDINSQPLQFLSVPYNPNLYFSKNAFLNTPNLQWFEFTGSGQMMVPEDIFSTLYNLEYVNYAQNKISILETNSINVPNNTMTYLDFRYNDIRSVQQGAIQGLHRACTMFFMFNSISTLDEDVWRPIFEVVGQTDETQQIFLDNNPLDCSCSIAWLVLNNTLLKEISQFSACADGGPNILELDPRFFAANC